MSTQQRSSTASTRHLGIIVYGQHGIGGIGKKKRGQDKAEKRTNPKTRRKNQEEEKEKEEKKREKKNKKKGQFWN